MNINPDLAKDILCKNILIYGYCKFENKGCAFGHSTKAVSGPPPGQQTTAAPAPAASNAPPAPQEPTISPVTPNNADAKRRFNLNTPSFQPAGVPALTNKFATLSPKLKEIPVFVPSTEKEDTSTAGKKFNASTPSFTPLTNPYEGANSAPASAPQPASAGQYTANSDFLFQQPSSYPLNYHLYAPPPPPRLAMPLPPHETNAAQMFIANDLRESLQRRNEATLQTLPQSNLPDHVNGYHSLVPIDKSFDAVSRVWSVPTAIYKVFSNADGNSYAIRRIGEHGRIASEAPFRTIKKWKSVRSANVVQLHDAFTSMAFGGSAPSLMVAYDYYPNASTLLEQHATRKLAGGKLEPITEDLLWTYLIQLTNALVTIHGKGLAARSSMDPSKIVVSGKNRVRLAAVGISDIIHHEEDEQIISETGLGDFIAKSQQKDIQALGKVLLDLATLVAPPNLRNLAPQEAIIALRTPGNATGGVAYTPEFLRVLETLVSDDAVDMDRFCERYLSNRLVRMVDGLQELHDFVEAQLSTELENARLFRLITKINFIVDRPEHASALEYGKNGNKHLIKLFKDFIFLQYDEFGKPVIDLSRVLTNLNKLDAGIDEKFLLISRDEKNCIIVSYKEIRDVIESVFRTLTR